MANLGPELEAGTHLGAGGLMGNPGIQREGGAAAMSHNYWETGLKKFSVLASPTGLASLSTQTAPSVSPPVGMSPLEAKGREQRSLPDTHRRLICGPPAHCISKRT